MTNAHPRHMLEQVGLTVKPPTFGLMHCVTMIEIIGCSEKSTQRSGDPAA
jgi:hypothetical protein